MATRSRSRSNRQRQWGIQSASGQIITRDSAGNQFTSRESVRREARRRPTYRPVRVSLSRA